MRVRYKRNKKIAYYNSDSLTTHPKSEAPVRPHGPFASCGDCPYPHHGFICYGKEGDCMKTDLRRMAERKNWKPTSVKWRYTHNESCTQQKKKKT